MVHHVRHHGAGRTGLADGGEHARWGFSFASLSMAVIISCTFFFVEYSRFGAAAAGHGLEILGAHDGPQSGTGQRARPPSLITAAIRDNLSPPPPMLIIFNRGSLFSLRIKLLGGGGTFSPEVTASINSAPCRP